MKKSLQIFLGSLTSILVYAAAVLMSGSVFLGDEYTFGTDSFGFFGVFLLLFYAVLLALLCKKKGATYFFKSGILVLALPLVSALLCVMFEQRMAGFVGILFGLFSFPVWSALNWFVLYIQNQWVGYVVLAFLAVLPILSTLLFYFPRPSKSQ